MISELMHRPTHRRIAQSVFCLAITGLLCASLLSCKKTSPPALHFGGEPEWKTGSDTSRWHWDFTGQSVKQISICLEVFENGGHKEVKRITFSDPSDGPGFNGELTVTVSGGYVFEEQATLTTRVEALIGDAFSSRSSTGEDYVFSTPEVVFGTGYAHSPDNPSAYEVLWCYQYHDQDVEHAQCSFETRAEIVGYSRQGCKLIVVSVEWEAE